MKAATGENYAYGGRELEIFAQATNWKRYWISRVAPFLKGDVLEAGSGAGANTTVLRPLCRGRYVSLEPDARLVREAEENLRHRLPETEFRTGTVESLSPNAMFDCVLYVDVLEHIEDDRGELACAAKHLRPGGYIVALAPAHNFLFSAFDAAIGHYRRYSRASLLRCSPRGTEVLRVVYLDSLGVVLSLANRVLLHSACPTHGQIQFWDRVVIPLSRYADALLGFRAGKSILAVWKVNDCRK